jgi:hypothetical protein
MKTSVIKVAYSGGNVSLDFVGTLILLLVVKEGTSIHIIVEMIVSMWLHLQG